jgi:hypothetical protein
MRRISLIVLFLVLTSRLTAGADAQQVEELKKALRDAEKRVSNYSLTMEAAVHMKPPGAANLTLATESITTFTADDRGRLKFERKGFKTTVSGKRESDTITKGAFNGEVYKEETDIKAGAGGKNVPNQGELAADPNGVAWGVDPRDCLWWYLRQPLSAVLEEHGVDTIEPDPAVPGGTIVTTRPVPHDNTLARYRLTIDRRRGFIAPVKEAMLQSPLDKRWVVYNRVAAESYHDIGQNIWVPSSVILEHYRLPKETYAPDIFTRGKATITNVSVNGAIGDDFFEMRFTDGTIINDRRTGKVLVAASKNAPPPATTAASGFELFVQEEERSARSDSRRYVWLTGAVVLGVALLALAAWRWRRRGGRRPLPGT